MINLKNIFQDNLIHDNHIYDEDDVKKLQELQDFYEDDIYDWYVVYEYVSNYSRAHLVSASDSDEAIQYVHEYLMEVEYDDPKNIQLSYEKVTV